jgi:hypothetical protein
MKRLLLTLCIFVGNTPWVLSDDAVIAVKPAIKVHTILSGVVKSVSWADSSKGTQSEIVVKDTMGKTTHILVTSTTTLWDADAKPVILDKTVVKKKVNVIYLTSEEGINVGKSIKILR